MNRTSVKKAIVLSIFAFGMWSCEQEFTEMGSEVIDNDSFGFDKYTVENIAVNNQESEIANTRNLPINNLGVYNHSTFGKTSAHVVTQLEINTGADMSNIGNNPVLDSVYLYIPHTSSVVSTDSDGNRTFKVSNIYGDGKFTLNVYENGYYLRPADPNNNFETQYYYADEKAVFDQHKTGINGNQRLNNSEDQSQNNDFQFNKNEIKLYAYDENGELQKDDNGKPIVRERFSPGIWLDLDKDYFQQRFFQNNQYQSIKTNNDLKNFFRGLYFEALDTNNQNAMAQLDLTQGELVFVYKQDGEIDPETNQLKRERKTFKFKMGFDHTANKSSSATTVNLLESNFTFDNNSGGNFWLKGGATSVLGAIDLFGEDSDSNGKADELETIIQNDWLINQAVLTLYIDKSRAGSDTLFYPNRLFLYDFNNNQVLIDYVTDQTTLPPKSRYNGILVTNKESVYRYQFQITDHINNLIRKDSTNVSLGLVVANDITNSVMNPTKGSEDKIPLTSTMSPFGTVIYGPNAGNGDLRMKLELYYTKENN